MNTFGLNQRGIYTCGLTLADVIVAVAWYKIVTFSLTRHSGLGFKLTKWYTVSNEQAQ